MAALVGARPGEIVFTSGATESNVRAIRGAIAAVAERGGPRTFVTSHAEHASVLALAARLGEEGLDVRRAGVDRAGRFDAGEVAALVPSAGAVVSVVATQPVTGAVEPVAEVAAALRGRAGVVLHSDAAQAVGRIPVDVRALGVDLLSFSAHKLGGPPGVGALFVREGTPFRAHDGGGSQELGRRPGTESFALAAGFGVAAALAARDLRCEAERARRLLAPLRAFVGTTPGGEVLTPADGALPNTLLVAFEGCSGETLLLLLDARGVRVSTGTACTSGARRPADVLLAGGRTAADAARAVRVSTSWRTTAADVERLCAAIGDALPRARAAAAST